MMYRFLRIVAGAAVLWSAGCGLISSDVTDFDLTLPDKKFTIDAGSWQVDQTSVDTFTSMSCADSAMVCASAAETACSEGCSGTCNAQKKCDLSLDISLAQPVDLVNEEPALKTINNEPVIKVSIDSVTYEVTSNSLSVATPQMTVYVAPMSVVTTDQATEIGSIPAVPAGWTTMGPQDVQFTATGKADLINIMSSFKTPFNVLVGSSILLTSGEPVPMGKLDAVVHIKAHAGL